MTAQLSTDLLDAALTREADRRNLSDRKIAKEIGISASAITRIRQKKQLGTDCLIAVLQWLGAPLEDFLVDSSTGLTATAARNENAALRNRISGFLKETAHPKHVKNLESAIFTILDIAVDHHEANSLIELPQMTARRGAIQYPEQGGWCAPSEILYDLPVNRDWDDDEDEIEMPATVRKIAEIMGIEPSLLADTDNNPIWDLIAQESPVSMRKWDQTNYETAATLILHEHLRRAEHAGEITAEEAEHRIGSWRVTVTSWGYPHIRHVMNGSGTLEAGPPNSEPG